MEIDPRTAVTMITQIVTAAAIIGALYATVQNIKTTLKELTGWIGRVEQEGRIAVKLLDDRMAIFSERTARLETACRIQHGVDGMQGSSAPKLHPASNLEEGI